MSAALLFQLRIVADHVAFETVRFQTCFLPNAMHRVFANAGLLAGMVGVQCLESVLPLSGGSGSVCRNQERTKRSLLYILWSRVSLVQVRHGTFFHIGDYLRWAVTHNCEPSTESEAEAQATCGCSCRSRDWHRGNGNLHVEIALKWIYMGDGLVARAPVLAQSRRRHP